MAESVYIITSFTTWYVCPRIFSFLPTTRPKPKLSLTILYTTLLIVIVILYTTLVDDSIFWKVEMENFEKCLERGGEGDRKTDFWERNNKKFSHFSHKGLKGPMEFSLYWFWAILRRNGGLQGVCTFQYWNKISCKFEPGQKEPWIQSDVCQQLTHHL